MKNKVFIGLLLLIFCSVFLGALEPFTKAEKEQYIKDGTWEQRLANAMRLGNYKTSPANIDIFKYKMQRLAFEQQGISPQALDLIMTPPLDWRNLPTTGTVKMLILLIAFSDKPFSNTASSISDKIFGGGNAANYPYESLHNFYARSSYDQLNITGNVLGWYTTAYPRSSIPQTDAGRENLIKEALNYYNAHGHDFTQYDNNHDGYIDYFAVVWTGADTGWANFWWGYMTNWYVFPTFTLDGKKLQGYSWQWEARPYPGTYTPNTLIHETGHGLGLPDLYHYSGYPGPKGGVGGLDQMDNNWGDHNSFSKYLLDWITPQVKSSGGGAITVHDSGTSKDNSLIVMPGAAAGQTFYEFFMVQNRTRTGNDLIASHPYPADGLLIWHVDATLDGTGRDFKYSNAFNYLNPTHKYLKLMEADGVEDIDNGGAAEAGDYYVTGKAFTPFTTPNSHTYLGVDTNISIRGISAAGPVMTFSYSMRRIYPPLLVSAQRVLNRSLTQFEYINVLKWSNNPSNNGLTVSKYRVYLVSDGTQTQLAEVIAPTVQYLHRHVDQNPRSYVIACVLDDGSEGEPLAVTIN